MTTDDHAPGEPCSCSESNAAEFHELIVALAAHRGIDVCGHDGPGPDDMDPDDDGDEDIGLDLKILHDLSLAQGAHCEGDDGEMDEEDDDEPEVRQFSEEEDDDDDEFDLDGIDGLDIDEENAAFSANSTDLVRTPPVNLDGS